MFMPVFSGHLVDALTRKRSRTSRPATLQCRPSVPSLRSTLLSMILRLAGLRAIVPFTLRIMSDVARDAFDAGAAVLDRLARQQLRGAVPCARSRGMWALDLLNDTILMALLPSLVVLLGSMVLLGLHGGLARFRGWRSARSSMCR